MLKFLLNRIPEDAARPTILLIDDDRDIRTVTGLVLLTSNLGKVLEAASGQEGLDMARQQRPDVILLDIGLPDMGGDIVLQLLKADPWTRDIPVVLFTAYANELRRLRALPVADIVLKPFQPELLCDTVRRAIRSTPAPGTVALPPRKRPHGNASQEPPAVCPAGLQ